MLVQKQVGQSTYNTNDKIDAGGIVVLASLDAGDDVPLLHMLVDVFDAGSLTF
jgi:hypothetical protein